jgi:hypothetical protein
MPGTTIPQSGLTEPIYEAVGACSLVFEDFLTQIERLDESLQVLQDYRVLFDKWVAYVGANYASRASLDSRLKLDARTREIVLGLLYMLRQNLEWSLFLHLAPHPLLS